MEYLNYSLEDFLADESFQQWVLSPQKADSQFWENWLEAHPEKHAVVAQARQVLKSIVHYEDQNIQEKQLKKVWQRIESSRKSKYPVIPPVTVKKTKTRHSWILPQFQGVAAAIIGSLICAITLYTFNKPAGFVEQRTAYGKTKTIVLPDQSTVMLNSNSKIRYASEWNTDQIREVWLEGEAFFSVVHTHNQQKFQVNTLSDMAVEVVGTQFNVKNRNSETRVVLKKGKVKLQINRQTKPTQITMAPNESVRLTGTASGYTKTKVDPQQYLSWTQHKLIFKNTSIAEIKTLLEETYGLKVIITDSSLWHEKISGSVPSNNVGSLLFALSESFNYQIIRKNNQLFFLEKSTK